MLSAEELNSCAHPAERHVKRMAVRKYKSRIDNIAGSGGARMSVREAVESGEAQLCASVSIGTARRNPFREHIGGQCQPPNFYLARVQYSFDSQPPYPRSPTFYLRHLVRHTGRSRRGHLEHGNTAIKSTAISTAANAAGLS